MFNVIACLRDQHNYGLVFLAACVCIAASFTAMFLMRRIVHIEEKTRWRGVLSAGGITGFGIWATHFIAMLAYSAGVSVSYDPLRTILSLIIAVGVTGAGIGLAVLERRLFWRLAGGAVVGLGVAGMHYTGMSALIAPMHIEWAKDLVAASVLSGMVFGAVALAVGLQDSRYGLWGGSLLMVTAVVTHHFIGMGAVRMVPDPIMSTKGVALDPGSLSVAIAVTASAVMAVCILNLRQRQHYEAVVADNERHLRILMDSVHDYAIYMLDPEGRVSNWNAGAQRFKGYTADEIVGRSFACFFSEDERLAGRPEEELRIARDSGRFETEGLRVRKDGTTFLAHVVLTPMYETDGRLIGFAKVTQDITERRRDEERIAHMARHDGLTGLPNRAHFNQHLARELEWATRNGYHIAALAIDLNHFKEINDTQGHSAGDQVLKAVASRLLMTCGETEFVARLGGDEFACVKRFSETRELSDFVSRVHAALYDRIDLSGYEVATGGAIGVAVYPEDADRGELLMNNADLAMYRAKSMTPGANAQTVCYYEAKMDEVARDRRAIAQDLWQAIARKELHVYYQVQKSVISQAITGYEALLRWQHPERGFVSPVDFIPVAEECGAILSIGEWVLRTACIEAAGWDNEARIAVNLSPVQLSHPDLPGLVRTVLFESGLSPRRLELEITESTIISDKARALHILRQIKAMGVTIAIDDFGTGYSSLDTLNAFPFDKIKIDRSFLLEAGQSPQARAIIRAILALGKSLDVPVLAEGVETLAQLELLQSEGCDEAQGYLFGRPAAQVETQGNDRRSA